MGTVIPGQQSRLHNEVYNFIKPDNFKGQLNDQVAVITGASGTIGQVIARSFSTAGARLCLFDLNTNTLNESRQIYLGLGAKDIYTSSFDITEYTQCEAAIREFHTQDHQKFAKDMAVNVNGPFFLMRLVMPDFIRRKKGCIINVASRGGTIDTPFNISYNTSKTALIRLTACLQAEVDHAGLNDIHLYALHPGAVLTNMTKGSAPDPSLLEYCPDFIAQIPNWLAKFKTSPCVVGMTSVALATGIAKGVLRGRYYDCEQDLEDILAQGDVVRQNPDLYALKMTFFRRPFE